MHTAIRTAILVLCASATLARAADLTIRVDNVKSASGTVMVGLYDGAGNFLKRAAREGAAPAIRGRTTLVFTDLAPGEYGVAVYHDANGNGRMDANAMGIPIEPLAFSNDAQGHMGPPAFDAVKLAVPAAGVAVSVKLR